MKKFKELKKRESVWESYRAKALAEEAPHPGHVMDFSDRYEHSYHGYSDAKKSRDAYAAHLKSQGHKVKKHSLTNQLLHGSYGNVYKVSYLRPSIEHKKGLTETMEESRLHHVLKGHPYHHKTDAELHYIMKDAHEAEKAVGSHDTKASWKYADQQNDAASILGYRQRGGKQVPHPTPLKEVTERERASHKDRIQSTLNANKTSTHDKVKNAKDTHLGGHDVDDHRRILALKESPESYKVGDHVIPKIGPHKGQVHRVIHVHDTGHLNITPAHPGIKNRYHLGAARAHPDQVERVKKLEEAIRPEGMTNFGKPIKLKDYFEPWKTKKSITPLTKRKTVREAFEAAKKKVQGADFDKPKDTESTDQKDPGQAEVQAQPPKEEKKSNAPAPEKKGNKLEVKGVGVDDKFQPDPIVTPLTTMPDTASPKSGSQGVR